MGVAVLIFNFLIWYVSIGRPNGESWWHDVKYFISPIVTLFWQVLVGMSTKVACWWWHTTWKRCSRCSQLLEAPVCSSGGRGRSVHGTSRSCCYVHTRVVLRWRLVANICVQVAVICVLVAVICVQVTLDASGRRCNFNEQVWVSIEHRTALSWCTFVICQFSWLLAEDSSVLIMIVCLQVQ